ncbi:MAG: hypothetical protein JJ899_09015 [Alphaproteobacteria bacterium]|nr:hypothetical protein [Alphaproteobacteria bacterium]
MIEDFIFGMATAAFGGVLALMGLPSRFRTRLPSLPVQPVNETSLIVRRTLSVLAVVIGLLIAFIGVAMVWASLSGVAFVLPWWPPDGWPPAWWPFTESPPG